MGLAKTLFVGGWSVFAGTYLNDVGVYCGTVITVPYISVSMYKSRTAYAVRLLGVNYSSQLLTVLGKGMASRMLPMPVMYMTIRSKPRPKPAWRAEPYLRRSM